MSEISICFSEEASAGMLSPQPGWRESPRSRSRFSPGTSMHFEVEEDDYVGEVDGAGRSLPPSVGSARIAGEKVKLQLSAPHSGNASLAGGKKSPPEAVMIGEPAAASSEPRLLPPNPSDTTMQRFMMALHNAADASEKLEEVEAASPPLSRGPTQLPPGEGGGGEILSVAGSSSAVPPPAAAPPKLFSSPPLTLRSATPKKMPMKVLQALKSPPPPVAVVAVGAPASGSGRGVPKPLASVQETSGAVATATSVVPTTLQPPPPSSAPPVNVGAPAPALAEASKTVVESRPNPGPPAQHEPQKKSASGAAAAAAAAVSAPTRTERPKVVRSGPDPPPAAAQKKSSHSVQPPQAQQQRETERTEEADSGAVSPVDGGCGIFRMFHSSSSSSMTKKKKSAASAAKQPSRANSGASAQSVPSSPPSSLQKKAAPAATNVAGSRTSAAGGLEAGMTSSGDAAAAAVTEGVSPGEVDPLDKRGGDDEEKKRKTAVAVQRKSLAEEEEQEDALAADPPSYVDEAEPTPLFPHSSLSQSSPPPPSLTGRSDEGLALKGSRTIVEEILHMSTNSFGLPGSPAEAAAAASGGLVGMAPVLSRSHGSPEYAGAGTTAVYSVVDEVNEAEREILAEYAEDIDMKELTLHLPPLMDGHDEGDKKDMMVEVKGENGHGGNDGGLKGVPTADHPALLDDEFLFGATDNYPRLHTESGATAAAGDLPRHLGGEEENEDGGILLPRSVSGGERLAPHHQTVSPPPQRPSQRAGGSMTERTSSIPFVIMDESEGGGSHVSGAYVDHEDHVDSQEPDDQNDLREHHSVEKVQLPRGVAAHPNPMEDAEPQGGAQETKRPIHDGDKSLSVQNEEQEEEEEEEEAEEEQQEKGSATQRSQDPDKTGGLVETSRPAAMPADSGVMINAEKRQEKKTEGVADWFSLLETNAPVNAKLRRIMARERQLERELQVVDEAIRRRERHAYVREQQCMRTAAKEALPSRSAGVDTHQRATCTGKLGKYRAATITNGRSALPVWKQSSPEALRQRHVNHLPESERKKLVDSQRDGCHSTSYIALLCAAGGRLKSRREKRLSVAKREMMKGEERTGIAGQEEEKRKEVWDEPDCPRAPFFSVLEAFYEQVLSHWIPAARQPCGDAEDAMAMGEREGEGAVDGFSSSPSAALTTQQREVLLECFKRHYYEESCFTDQDHSITEEEYAEQVYAVRPSCAACGPQTAEEYAFLALLREVTRIQQERKAVLQAAAPTAAASPSSPPISSSITPSFQIAKRFREELYERRKPRGRGALHSALPVRRRDAAHHPSGASRNVTWIVEQDRRENADSAVTVESESSQNLLSRTDATVHRHLSLSATLTTTTTTTTTEEAPPVPPTVNDGVAPGGEHLPCTIHSDSSAKTSLSNPYKSAEREESGNALCCDTVTRDVHGAPTAPARTKTAMKMTTRGVRVGQRRCGGNASPTAPPASPPHDSLPFTRDDIAPEVVSAFVRLLMEFHGMRSPPVSPQKMSVATMAARNGYKKHVQRKKKKNHHPYPTRSRGAHDNSPRIPRECVLDPSERNGPRDGAYGDAGGQRESSAVRPGAKQGERMLQVPWLYASLESLTLSRQSIGADETQHGRARNRVYRHGSEEDDARSGTYSPWEVDDEDENSFHFSPLPPQRPTGQDEEAAALMTFQSDSTPQSLQDEEEGHHHDEDDESDGLEFVEIGRLDDDSVPRRLRDDVGSGRRQQQHSTTASDFSPSTNELPLGPTSPSEHLSFSYAVEEHSYVEVERYAPVEERSESDADDSHGVWKDSEEDQEEDHHHHLHHHVRDTTHRRHHHHHHHHHQQQEDSSAETEEVDPNASSEDSAHASPPVFRPPVVGDYRSTFSSSASAQGEEEEAAERAGGTLHSSCAAGSTTPTFAESSMVMEESRMEDGSAAEGSDQPLPPSRANPLPSAPKAASEAREDGTDAVAEVKRETIERGDEDDEEEEEGEEKHRSGDALSAEPHHPQDPSPEEHDVDEEREEGEDEEEVDSPGQFSLPPSLLQSGVEFQEVHDEGDGVEGNSATSGQANDMVVRRTLTTTGGSLEFEADLVVEGSSNEDDIPTNTTTTNTSHHLDGRPLRPGRRRRQPYDSVTSIVDSTSGVMVTPPSAPHRGGEPHSAPPHIPPPPSLPLITSPPAEPQPQSVELVLDDDHDDDENEEREQEEDDVAEQELVLIEDDHAEGQLTEAEKEPHSESSGRRSNNNASLPNDNGEGDHIRGEEWNLEEATNEKLQEVCEGGAVGHPERRLSSAAPVSPDVEAVDVDEREGEREKSIPSRHDETNEALRDTVMNHCSGVDEHTNHLLPTPQSPVLMVDHQTSPIPSEESVSEEQKQGTHDASSVPMTPGNRNSEEEGSEERRRRQVEQERAEVEQRARQRQRERERELAMLEKLNELEARLICTLPTYFEKGEDENGNPVAVLRRDREGAAVPSSGAVASGTAAYTDRRKIPPTTTPRTPPTRDAAELKADNSPELLTRETDTSPARSLTSPSHGGGRERTVPWTEVDRVALGRGDGDVWGGGKTTPRSTSLPSRYQPIPLSHHSDRWPINAHYVSPYRTQGHYVSSPSLSRCRGVPYHDGSDTEGDEDDGDEDYGVGTTSRKYFPASRQVIPPPPVQYHQYNAHPYRPSSRHQPRRVVGLESDEKEDRVEGGRRKCVPSLRAAGSQARGPADRDLIRTLIDLRAERDALRDEVDIYRISS